MGRGPEGKVQDAVIRYARTKYNALCVKNEAGRYFTGGFLDYTIYPDKRLKKTARVFVIEFKAPGGALTPKQVHNVMELRNRGHPAYRVDNVGAGRAIVDAECS